MADLDGLLAADRQAVAGFLSAARSLPASAWAESTAPGQWSPAQTAEHVAIGYELGRAVVHGTFPGRSAPGLVRYLLRTFFLEPVLRNGRFKIRSKTPPPFRPSAQPGPTSVVLPRLEAAAAAFEQAIIAEAAAGRSLKHPFFGTLTPEDYLQFLVIHTNHHRRQLPALAGD